MRDHNRFIIYLDRSDDGFSEDIRNTPILLFDKYRKTIGWKYLDDITRISIQLSIVIRKVQRKRNKTYTDI